jgi:serine/threonine-protein kinase PRP4
MREVLKKYGKDVGLNLKAIQIYARQLFTALDLLKQLDIVHGDIKPDNILLNETKTSVRLADFGTSCDAATADIQPYLASRFYRAPEVILGCKFGCEIDMWSMGCTLFELCTGHVMIPGSSNNQMLKLMMDLKGRMSPKVVRQGRLGSKYFDLDNLAFTFQDFDQLTGNLVDRILNYGPNPKKDIKGLIVNDQMTAAERHQAGLFADLISKCLDLQPDKRLTPRAALTHPFCTIAIK